MDYKKILDKVSEYNIDQNKVLELVGEAKTLDLSDEDNLRLIIKRGAALAHKELSKEDEDHIVALIKERGIGPDLLNLI